MAAGASFSIFHGSVRHFYSADTRESIHVASLFHLSTVRVECHHLRCTFGLISVSAEHWTAGDTMERGGSGAGSTMFSDHEWLESLRVNSFCMNQRKVLFPLFYSSSEPWPRCSSLAFPGLPRAWSKCHFQEMGLLSLTVPGICLTLKQQP